VERGKTMWEEAKRGKVGERQCEREGKAKGGRVERRVMERGETR
jgi:hypothetical protein